MFILAYFYFTSAVYSQRYFIKSVKEFLTFKDLNALNKHDHKLY